MIGKRHESNLLDCDPQFIMYWYYRISLYATASTNESIYIIGGYVGGSASYTSTIAEYKEENWKNVGNLAQARAYHGAITSESTTMSVGGYPNRGSL